MVFFLFRLVTFSLPLICVEGLTQALSRPLPLCFHAGDDCRCWSRRQSFQPELRQVPAHIYGGPGFER